MTTPKNEIDIKGKVNHSACRWCYKDIPLEKLADQAKAIGLKSIELLNPDEWDVMIKRGLTCAISNGSSLGITKGFNDVQYHDQLRADYEKLIPRAADKGIGQVICFSGNRGTISDKTGLEHCAKGLDKLVKLGEKYKVKIVMELLNSKVDHKDYMCDHTAWGAALVDKIGSPNFKLLYDIYHMQIMEGDVIATIRKYKDYISHYHTGGVPGRNEINDTQELNYKAIMAAIVATGFQGFVAQEFIPTRKDAIASLKEGIKICDV
ncbi:MAG: TIM barrel protein [Saprospiraceae bacterium]|nr:TIM barrel protein [Saprospiraceae bacterium]